MPKFWAYIGLILAFFRDYVATMDSFPCALFTPAPPGLGIFERAMQNHCRRTECTLGLPHPGMALCTLNTFSRPLFVTWYMVQGEFWKLGGFDLVGVQKVIHFGT